MMENQWDGPFIAQKYKDQRTPEEQRFENMPNSHKMLLVEQTITTNEFIVMLHKRFFSDIDLKDIWIYRVQQFKCKVNH